VLSSSFAALDRHYLVRLHAGARQNRPQECEVGSGPS